MNLSKNQIEMLKDLNENINNKMPCDKYNRATINALLKLGLIEKYSYSNFLHGAVKISEKGIEFLKCSI